jgi:hypothetical protein
MKRLVFGIDPGEASFERRGFAAKGEESRHRLESIGVTFIDGYDLALQHEDPAALAAALSRINLERRGFAFEGAAMSLALQDLLLPWRRDRLERFLAGPGSAHAYMLHVGAGWALARMRTGTGRYFQRIDPLLRWLAMDGYGFHEGYFHARRTIDAGRRPRGLRGYARRAFDQGLGRSLWFVCGADVEQTARVVAGLAPERHGDLWSGVGLAAAYAGGASATELEVLRKLAGAHLPALAQGVAFAAKARQRAGNPAAHTALGCRVICRESLPGAAQATDVALEGVGDDTGDEPAYEQWRQRVQNHFQGTAT